MPTCVECGGTTAADEGSMTGEGLICSKCDDGRKLDALERRAAAAVKLGARDPENAFGDATFNPKKRKAAVLLFVVSLLLLLVLYALRLGRKL